MNDGLAGHEEKEIMESPVTTESPVGRCPVQAVVRPRRRLTFEMSAHADTVEDMVAALKEAADCVRNGYNGRTTTGGCGSGWSTKLEDDPTITPEIYAERLKVYLESVKL